MIQKGIFIFLFLVLAQSSGMGHPMPHSIFSLQVKADKILGELQIPLPELQMAVPFDVSENTENLPQDARRQQLSDYFLAHLRPKSANGLDWKVDILDMSILENEQEATGKYKELLLQVSMQPPAGEPVRQFSLYYDGILHQVVTHKIFVTIKQDWKNGQNHPETAYSLGAIELDIASNGISPMPIKLDEGSTLNGFVSMVRLGIDHIAEGTDHLLFLLVLLLPATLLASNGRWTTFAGTRKSVMNILKIVTAFTIGHSLSLCLGATQWLILPSQPVEIAIAFTILITAIHAIRPLFPQREILIAIVFGLVHGLAFSTVLTELNLDTKELTYSILGYNIGIEIMQIFVIFITIPWFIILSKNNHFQWIRIGGAILAIIASLAWAMERVQSKPNIISQSMEQIFQHGKYLALVLMLLAAASTISLRKIHKG